MKERLKNIEDEIRCVNYCWRCVWINNFFYSISFYISYGNIIRSFTEWSDINIIIKILLSYFILTRGKIR